MKTRIRCHVLEAPADDRNSPRSKQAPRDLLPWADPYIASLVSRLERECAEHNFDSDPFDADDESSDAAFENDWEDDAFMPRSFGPSRLNWDVPVYGGFPLLEE